LNEQRRRYSLFFSVVAGLGARQLSDCLLSLRFQIMFSGWQRDVLDGPLGLLAAAGASLSRSNEPSDPEYMSLRVTVDATVTSLVDALAHIDAVQKAWRTIADGHVSLCVAVASAEGAPAPRRCEGAVAAKVFAQSVARNSDKRQAASHLHAYVQVRRYLEHLRGIQSRFPDIAKAKSEYETHRRKVRGLESRNQSNGSANLEHTRECEERARSMYFAMLSRLIERMRAAVEKRTVAFDLMQHAFWLQQSTFHRAMAVSELVVIDTARATEPVVVSTNLLEGLSPPDTMFSSLYAH
jgi:hypothetical protein